MRSRESTGPDVVSAVAELRARPQKVAEASLTTGQTAGRRFTAALMRTPTAGAFPTKPEVAGKTSLLSCTADSQQGAFSRWWHSCLGQW